MTLLTKLAICETYYDILNVKEDASYEEIRVSNRSALLQSHPDKLHNSCSTPNAGNNVEDGFIKIQKAWETLGDSRLRTLYDNKLQSLRSDLLVAEDVAFEDLVVEDTGEALEFYYQCRCGDCFLICGSELEEMGFKFCRDEEDDVSVQTPEALPCSVVVPCGSCSLIIRLLIGMNSSVPVEGKV